MIQLKRHRIIPRIADGHGQHVACSGGLRFSELEPDIWLLEPVLLSGKPSTVGTFTKSEMMAYLRHNGIIPIAIHRTHWTNGVYWANWTPIVESGNPIEDDPVRMWLASASNMQTKRLEHTLEKSNILKIDQFNEVMNSGTEVENICQSIGLSLSSMSSHIEFFSDFYNEHLVNILSEPADLNSPRSTHQDETFFAHAHAFFMHFGIARDYLAKLIGMRKRVIGNPDDLQRLLGKVRSTDSDQDSIFDLLIYERVITKKQTSELYFQHDGWLRYFSDIRRQFVHGRPLGLRAEERVGSVKAIDEKLGLYRYWRPYIHEDGHEIDLFDTAVDCYIKAMSLFKKAAECSGYDTGMLTLTDSDIISIGTADIKDKE